MEFLVVVCAAIAVGAMILSFLFLRLSQREAEKAVSFADDARNWMNEALSERLCVQAIKEEVEYRVIGLEAWSKSFVEKLEVAESLAVKYAEKAERFSETANFSQQAAESYLLQAREQADKVAEIAEVVKIEVAKIETLIAKLNKDRAENPPFVAITYGEESGEPEKVEVSINEKGVVDAAVERLKECRDEIIKHAEGTITTTIKGVDGVLRGYTVVPLNPLLPTGQPFEFKPTQVHPVIKEGGE